MMDSCGVKLAFMMILINAFSISSAELIRPPQPPQHNYAFNKFRPPPPPEPTFIQRVTNWFFPWGGVSSEEEYHLPASPKIDSSYQPRPQQYPFSALHSANPVQVRDTEPTTARTTQSPPATKCSPCNKVPWVPMMPSYQLPLVKPSGQPQTYFKHHFDNENQYAQIPASAGYSYGPPSTTQPPLTTPIKYQDGSNFNQGHQFYGAPPVKNVQNQFQGYQYPPQQPDFSKATSKPNTIDSSVITFTTKRPQHNRPLRFTAAGTVTNPEYLLPPNVLPLEGENGQFAPIPIPNLSPSPIPPLFDAKPFHDDPFSRKNTGFIKLVPLEPIGQLSNNINVQVKPEGNLARFEPSNDEGAAIEVINSNLVAEFTLPPQTVHNNSPSTTRAPVQTNFGINFDLGNSLDSNTTINSPIIVESLETATDSYSAGSEQNYHHNIQQALEPPLNRLNKSEDDQIDAEESNRVLTTRNNFQNEDLDETTTEGNYFIKFEPSLQTSADLAEKAVKDNSDRLKKNRDRLTPLELLDSPIFHVTTFTAKPVTATFTEPPPPFKPLDEFTKRLATLWTSPMPVSTSTEPTVTPTYRTTSEKLTTSSLPPVKSTTLSFLAQLSSGRYSGITPPKEPPRELKIAGSTKKPKQIQIVIPYTSYHKPSPFKVQAEQDFITYRPIRGHYVTHSSKSSESVTTRTTETSDAKTTESSTTEKIEPSTARKIDPSAFFTTKKSDPIEINNLKIEDSFNGQGYHNDQEYPEHAQESKIVESKVTIEPPKTTKYLTKILANNIRELLKKEKTPKPPKIDLIRLQKNIDGWTEQSFKGKASTLSLMGHTKAIPKSYLSTTMKATTFMKVPTTTLSPKTTFDPALMEETKRQYDNILYKKDDNLLYVKRHDRFLSRDNEHVLLNNNLTYNSFHEGVKVFAPKTTLTPKELWKRLHLTVSPLTNERIYVVTPQPRQESIDEKLSTFKPRFAVRPTAGMKQPKKLKAEDRMDFVHMMSPDGHAKVVRIITPEQDGITSSIEVTSEKPKS